MWQEGWAEARPQAAGTGQAAGSSARRRPEGHPGCPGRAAAGPGSAPLPRRRRRPAGGRPAPPHLRRSGPAAAASLCAGPWAAPRRPSALRRDTPSLAAVGSRRPRRRARRRLPGGSGRAGPQPRAERPSRHRGAAARGAARFRFRPAPAAAARPTNLCGETASEAQRRRDGGEPGAAAAPRPLRSSRGPPGPSCPWS